MFSSKNHKRINNLNFHELEKKYEIDYIDHNDNRLSIWRKLLFIDQMRFKLGYQNNSVRKLRYKTHNWKFSFISFFGITSDIKLLYNKIQINKLTKNLIKKF